MTPAKIEPSPREIARVLEEYLAQHPQAMLLEDGSVLFEMARSSYSLGAEHGRCILHVWSEERNVVRTVVGLETRKTSLRLLVRRLGAPRNQSWQLLPDREQRTPGLRAGARKAYLRQIERILTRYFNDYTIESMRSAMDLEHSFGPAYARGVLVRGRGSWAVIGVNAGEAQATIDGMLSLGILWLAYCREHAGNRVCHGLKVLLPCKTGAATRARMAWLNPALAQWELYEISEGTDELERVDLLETGNLAMRLLHAFDPQAAIERAQAGLERILRVLPEGMRHRVVLRARSAHEVALSLYGLEFARVRHGFAPDSFTRQDILTFGAGQNETPLTPETEEWFADLARRLFASRHPAGSASNPLYRLQPEAWLESVLRLDPGRIEPDFSLSPVYAQVPAFAAGDRSTMDLLTATRGGRLAVLELKAQEDLHLPLQGLDYWMRVRFLQEQRGAGNDGGGELERSGYFPHTPLLRQTPLLYYVVPALHVHPSMETILAYFSPEVPWTLVALSEGWRTECRAVFRKHSSGNAVPFGA